MDVDEASCCNNTPPSELISNAPLPVDYEDQTELLKGDAIGNTLYSERYVLKILMKLSLVTENDWSEDFESDLCTLWDMTIERDIVKFLMEHNFLRIAVNVLQGPLQEPRFIEIIVGILRNMSCCDNVRQVISERPEVTSLLIQLLSSSDSLTLIQLMRLFDSVAWDLLKEVDQRSSTSQVHWLVKLMDCQLLSDKLSFLLCSSTNDELLYSVLDVLNTLCIKSPSLGDKDFSQYFATKDMVSSLLECWKQLFITSASSIGDDVDDIEGDDNQVENELFLSKHMFKAAKKWIAIVASFAGHEKGREALESHGDSLTTIVSRLMSMIDEDERCEEMLIDIVIILEALVQLHMVPACFKKLLTIFYDIIQKQGDIAAASKNSSLVNFIENFFEYAVRYGSKAKLSEALEICEGEDHLVLLFWSIIEKRDPELVADWKSDMNKPFDERSV